jgi:phage-related protein
MLLRAVGRPVFLRKYGNLSTLPAADGAAIVMLTLRSTHQRTHQPTCSYVPFMIHIQKSLVGVVPPKTPLVFFCTTAGNEPVRDWLQALDRTDRHTIGQDLSRAQWRWPVGMPLCRSLGDGLWEVRTTLLGHRQARVLICHHQGELWALHAFEKKTRKTPKSDLDLAARRLNAVLKS